MSTPNLTFETERTRRLRASALAARDQVTLSHIETFGCSIIHVPKSSAGAAWSYTVGVYDTSGQPEIIVVGLQQPTAHSLLNAAANQLRSGMDLTSRRYREMIGEVECEFRPVSKNWVEHLMGYALWYYDGAPFPVLQAIYPDLQNVFPEEAGFDDRFWQPLMDSGDPMTDVERDFWSSADPKSSLFDWRFPDPPHTKVYLSQTVNDCTEPVVYVSHDLSDGAWQFLGNSMSKGGGPVVTCLHHPLDRDPTLKELADLPLGWCAERKTPASPWLRREMEPEEGD